MPKGIMSYTFISQLTVNLKPQIQFAGLSLEQVGLVTGRVLEISACVPDT